jgi:glucose-1-phosphate thymidylyltransferase
VANRPLIDYALDAMRASGIEHVIVVVAPATGGEIRDELEGRSKSALLLSYVEQEPCRPGAAALLAARPLLDRRPALVYEGDGLVAGDVASHVAEFANAELDALLLTHPELPQPGGTAPDAGSSANYEDEPCPSLTQRRLAAAGILGPSAFDVLAKLHASAPPSEMLTLAAERLIGCGGAVATRGVEGSWVYDGSVQGLLDANRMVLDRIDGATRTDAPTVRIEGRVQIAPDAEIERTLVRGPAVIGSGAVIADSFIGPYSAVGDEARIVGTEIEYSVLLPHARIRNLGHRLEGSLVGRDARVCRDFAVPSALRLNVGQGAEVLIS